MTLSPAIAFAHGFLGNGSFWAPIFPQLLKAFPEANLIAPDLPGHGTADASQDVIAAMESFEDAVRWFADKTRNASCPWTIGYSMGARLSLGSVLHAPKLYRGAVFISLHPGLGQDDERQRRQEWEQHLCGLALQGGMESLVKSFEALPIFDSQRTLSKRLLTAQRNARLNHQPANIVAATALLGLGQTPDMRKKLDKIDCPVLFVTGALDEKYCLIAKALASKSARFNHVAIPRAGHNPVLEQPGQTSAVIIEFMQKNS